MIMEARQKRLSTPLQWGRREKTAVAGALAAALIALIALGAYALTSGGAARHDCIEVVFPSTLGGAKLHACGANARRICASPSSYKSLGDDLRAACKKATLPYVAPS